MHVNKFNLPTEDAAYLLTCEPGMLHSTILAATTRTAGVTALNVQMASAPLASFTKQSSGTWSWIRILTIWSCFLAMASTTSLGMTVAPQLQVSTHMMRCILGPIAAEFNL